MTLAFLSTQGFRKPLSAFFGLSILILMVLSASWASAAGLGNARYSNPVRRVPYVPIVELGTPEDRRLPMANVAKWLDQYPETGMTFLEYICSKPIRPIERRNTIYLRPMGYFNDRAVLAKLVCFLSAYYSVPVKIGKHIDMPEEALSHGGRRYDADQVIFSLSAATPADALLTVGITDRDLSSGRLSGVFGLGYADMRSCIVSTKRIWVDSKRGGTGQEAFRLCKVVAHEIGHTMGLPHCSAYRCIMNSTSGVTSIDRAPVNLCGPCSKKLRWAFNWKPLARAQAITQVSRKLGWSKVGYEFAPLVARLRQEKRAPSTLVAALPEFD